MFTSFPCEVSVNGVGGNGPALPGRGRAGRSGRLSGALRRVGERLIGQVVLALPTATVGKAVGLLGERHGGLAEREVIGRGRGQGAVVEALGPRRIRGHVFGGR